MAIELLRFLFGALILLLPGVLLARRLSLGRDRLERGTYGACLGLALAVYVASAISQFNLHWFYPVWFIILVVSAARFRRANSAPIDPWMIPILLIVAASRFAIALPQTLPKGWDPTFHMILARKIQLTQHAIFDWSPFEPAALNYPTGSHTLIVVLSALTGLPLHTVFKDLIPLLGVLTTAQIYILARRITFDDAAARYAALAYGMWANAGSIGYYDWGGLPNELALLLFLSMLSVWLEDSSPKPRLAAMTILYASTILVHHHVMLVSAVLLLVIILCTIRRLPGRLLALAVPIAVALDLFFLIPFAAKAVTLNSTRVLHGGEVPVDLPGLWSMMGYLYVIMAIIGIALWRRGPLLILISFTMIAMFIAAEYLWPMWQAAHGRPPSTAFTPSRFPTDLNSFLALFVGTGIVSLQRKLRWPTTAIIALMLVAACTEIRIWTDMATGSGVSPAFIEACQWIHDNTPPDTAVLSHENWTTYLTWRQTGSTPMPDSEPLFDLPPRLTAPEIVAILDSSANTGLPILWRGTGLEVVRTSP
jgi:hypothetical protein